ncbi:uncharacterized protein Dana_GF26340 [Drosophila ananassae]|uniref:BPTI/Kunitz inhibitor domain-containing protein n=1 Tax=Drosophila ananassae TaxID=7217 RepID=A0A0P8YP94_DROAN|nr:uncharacterized protein Dana_GF26340 [Drosophila ananassae]
MKLLRIFLALLPFLVVVQPQINLLRLEGRDFRCYKNLSYGRCKGHRQMWGFAVEEKKCVSFIYSNCGGNDNRFYSESACMETCKRPLVSPVTPENFK